MLRRIELDNPLLTPQEVRALSEMLIKREQYVSQGRIREAHGAGTMCMILWESLMGHFPDTQATDWAGL